jgi:hypothetical protein
MRGLWINEAEDQSGLDTLRLDDLANVDAATIQDKTFLQYDATSDTFKGVANTVAAWRSADVPSGSSGGSGLTHTWFSLIRASDRVVLATTVDDTAATWAADTEKRFCSRRHRVAAAAGAITAKAVVVGAELLK